MIPKNKWSHRPEKHFTNSSSLCYSESSCKSYWISVSVMSSNINGILTTAMKTVPSQRRLRASCVWTILFFLHFRTPNKSKGRSQPAELFFFSLATLWKECWFFVLFCTFIHKCWCHFWTDFEIFESEICVCVYSI